MLPKMKYYIPSSTNKAFFMLMLIIAAIVLIVYNASAQPVISIHNNSNTNTSSSYGIFLDNGESITFRANTTNSSNTWHWYRDGISVVNNFDNYTTSFTTGSYHYVSLNTSNASGYSNNLTWGINVFPAMATSPAYDIQLLNETPAEVLDRAIDNKSFPEIVSAPLQIYINLIGLGFYAFVWFIAFGMMWIKQASINIPTVVGVIFGGIIITFLPAQYQLVSQVLIVFGIFAVIYIFFKGRG